MIEVTWNIWTRRHAMFWSLGSSRLKRGYSAPGKMRQICQWTTFSSVTVCSTLFNLRLILRDFVYIIHLIRKRRWVWKQPRKVSSVKLVNKWFYSVYVWFLFALTRFSNTLAIFWSCLLCFSGRKKFILSSKAPLKEVDPLLKVTI